MERRETSLERKIKQSIEYFKKAYFKYGYFRKDYGKGVGSDDSPDYYEVLDENYCSKIVGNSSFSPRIRRVPVYPEGHIHSGWAFPAYFKWALSIHPKLGDGIREEVYSENMKEICIDVDSMSEEDMIEMIEDFLRLSNEDVLRKFKIDKRIFSQESLDTMRNVDMRNKLINQTEESLGEFYGYECQVRNGQNQELKDERIVC